MFNQYDKKEGDGYALMLPFEKSFDAWTLNSTLVYKDIDDQNDYIGLENSLLYTINDHAFVRAIVDLDQDENDDNNFGYSLTYSILFQSRIMLRVTAAKIDASTFNDERIEASVSMFF
jgi:hypothetical protein